MNTKYYLTENTVLKRLEKSCLYQIDTDELYEMDDEGFCIIRECAGYEGCRIKDRDFLAFCLEERLLGLEYTGKRKIPQRSSPVPSLRYLELQVTNRCNLSCSHCYIGSPAGSELELDSVIRVLQEFEEMQGLRLLITGGEPLLYSGFKDMNNELPGLEFRKVLFTNGLLLNSNVLDSLNVNEIQVSIDGLEESHDSIRGKGSFGKAMKGIKIALKAGFDVSISTMIHKRNLHDFEKMESTFRTMGIRDWTVDVPCVSGNLKENLSILPPVEIAGKYLKYGYGNALHGGGDGYSCGLHLMSVMSDGKAGKCGFYSDRSVGNISEGLEECWKKVEHIPLNELECDCNVIESCRGGCRYRAEISGSRYGKDPFRCAALDR